jgi:hypothetical protein
MATVIEVDCSTGVSTERDMTPDEIAAQAAMAQAQADKAAADAAAQAAKDAALASARAKLAALGLTADEVAALTA